MVSRISFLNVLRPGRNIDTPVSTNDPLPVTLLGGAGSHASDTTSTSTLAAGATYTSPTVDQGAIPSAWGTRLRSEVVHAAGNAFGHLTVEQSPDGTTWRETERVPVPSDGQQHGFEAPIHQRYYRTKFINGATAQTAFYTHSYRVAGEGPSIDIRQNLQFALTQTPLAANAQFTSPVLDLGSSHQWDRIRLTVSGDQAGTFVVDQSRNSSIWSALRPSDAGLGATLAGVGTTYPNNSAEFSEYKIQERFLRARVGNGQTTAQTFLEVNAALISL